MFHLLSGMMNKPSHGVSNLFDSMSQLRGECIITAMQSLNPEDMATFEYTDDSTPAPSQRLCW